MPNTTRWMPGMPGMPNTTGWRMPSWRSANPDPNMTNATATANMSGNFTPTPAPTLADVIDRIGSVMPVVSLRSLRGANTDPVNLGVQEGLECPADRNDIVSVLEGHTSSSPSQEQSTPIEEPREEPREEPKSRVDRVKSLFGLGGGKVTKRKRRRGKKSKRKHKKVKTRRRKRKLRKRTRKY